MIVQSHWFSGAVSPLVSDASNLSFQGSETPNRLLDGANGSVLVAAPGKAIESQWGWVIFHPRVE